jgi:hypothetical protein
MTSGRSILLLFGVMLFFLLAFFQYASDSIDFGHLLGVPAKKPLIPGAFLWLVFGSVYLLVLLGSVKRDFSNRKRKS